MGPSIYKYVTYPLLGTITIGGFVTPNYFRDALPAMQYLALPFSPMARTALRDTIGVPATWQSPGTITWQTLTAGVRCDNNRMRRAWAAFGCHGGAWERVLAPSFPLEGGTYPAWCVSEPSLNLPRFPRRIGEFVRDSDWGSWAAIALQIALAIVRGVRAGGGSDDDGVTDDGPTIGDDRQGTGNLKVDERTAGGVLHFLLASATLEWSVSYLAILDRTGSDVVAVQLFSALWRDIDGDYRELIWESQRRILLLRPVRLAGKTIFDPTDDTHIEATAEHLRREVDTVTVHMHRKGHPPKRLIVLP